MLTRLVRLVDLAVVALLPVEVARGRHRVGALRTAPKVEGDGFWMVFPSATAAALAAMSVREALRLSQRGKGEDRLAMRIILTVGDVLHLEGGLVGDAVVSFASGASSEEYAMALAATGGGCRRGRDRSEPSCFNGRISPMLKRAR